MILRQKRDYQRAVESHSIVSESNLTQHKSASIYPASITVDVVVADSLY